jgi:hypothetical protein
MSYPDTSNRNALLHFADEPKASAKKPLKMFFERLLEVTRFFGAGPKSTSRFASMILAFPIIMPGRFWGVGE